MDIEKVIAFQKRIDELFDVRESVVQNRVALKLSSEVVVDENGLFNAGLINPLVERCSYLMDLSEQRFEFHFITSGAFALGSARMKRQDSNFDPKNCDIVTRQVIASSGQIELFHRWEEEFRDCGKTVVQFLISDHDWIGKDSADTRRRIGNLRRPLLHTLKMRMVPVDNGNDGTNNTGMKELITSRDNDPLAVIRAYMARAKYLIYGVSDADGVLDKNRQVIPEITSLDDLERVHDHGRLDDKGTTTGGISSKVASGAAFGRGGREAFIVNARMLCAIEGILAGKIGTRIAIAA